MNQRILRRCTAAGLAVALCLGTAGPGFAFAGPSLRLGDSGVGSIQDSGKLRMARANLPTNDYDVSTGTVSLTAGDVCSGEDPHVITGTSHNTNNVTVVGGEHYIVLKDLSITYDDGSSTTPTRAGTCAFDIQGTSTVHLELVGTNTLQSGAFKAGLHLPQGATLTIDAAAGASGVLNVTGGARAAGIGGHGGIPSSGTTPNGESCGELTITGWATVNAQNPSSASDASGAAIGGGV